jgi:indolepyruvate ferredoxin oxidoreductase
MNAPMPEHIRRALQEVSLDDKYALDTGRAFMSGVQALVKLPMLQRARDAQRGYNTAGFISGYRGSPLGSYDQSLHKAKAHLARNNIVFQPGVNEDLAATALWGTQQLGFAPKGTQRFDGVFGIWYGKGPGVDRTADVFKHANMAGTTPLGGVLAVAGDDHVAKSSTAAHQSDHIFKACGLPVFFPSSVQDILDLGLHALAMSRFAGVWAGMKTIQEIVESSATVVIDPNHINCVVPDFEMPPGGVHIRWPDAALEQEARLFDTKWYAAVAYIRANRLNHNVIEGPNDRFGIIASGKAYNDTRQALSDLGLDDARCQTLGIRVHKVAVVWPLEAQTTREFATGLREILVVEEKRQVIEYQLKEELYNWRSDVRPNVLGKFDEADGDTSGGEWSQANPSANTLLRANADLNPAIVARAIAKRLRRMDLPTDVLARMDSHLAVLDAKERAMVELNTKGAVADRMPWFCSGCPHNTSTRVPEGSRAMAGIGCHFMTVWMDRSTVGFTQMGGEGVPWVGQSAFSTEKHVFANLGDGTYFHSGLLAIRQSIAAGVNITYKLLYNDAVAMTGGQQIGERPEGHSVLQIAHSLKAEGVSDLVVVTDEPEKYQGVALPAGVKVEHRDELERIQLAFREQLGTTVIIYDQTCATEKRRRRKRGTMVDPDVRLVINEAVCEGCGDCGVKSNCLSVEPLETPLGRKRTINQNTCNKDQSCANGFCPSFVSVKGADTSRKATAVAAPVQRPSAWDGPGLAEPALPGLERPWGLLVAGVGGTGVITIGQLLGMAAHMEGKGVVTQDAAGLAQKGGATWSHIIVAQRQADIHTTRIDMAAADAILGCDPIVTAGKETMTRIKAGRTHVALNAHSAPTAAFVHNTQWHNPALECAAQLSASVAAGDLQSFNAEQVAVQLLGNSIFVNPLVLGFAWQHGWVPLRSESILRAMELNGVAVKDNQAAFQWGRRCAQDWAGVQALMTPTSVISLQRRASLRATIDLRVQLLTDYQNQAYAQIYLDAVQHMRDAERAVLGPYQGTGSADSDLTLTDVVAKQLYRMMAIKDEYEVARLHADPAFKARLNKEFGSAYTLNFHLAPPLLSKRNAKGELTKSRFGPWVMMAFAVLAKFKGLRGTALDVFGYTEERATERALRDDYLRLVQALTAGLSKANREQAIALANVVEPIKGFGHVRAKHMVPARARWAKLWAEWQHVSA